MNRRDQWRKHIEQKELGLEPAASRRPGSSYPQAPERAILYAVLQTLELHPKVKWVKRMNVGAMQIGNRLVRFGFPGMADITGQMRDGRRLEVEVKRKGEQPTLAQQAFLELVRDTNGVAFVARSSNDVIKNLGALAR